MNKQLYAESQTHDMFWKKIIMWFKWSVIPRLEFFKKHGAIIDRRNRIFFLCINLSGKRYLLLIMIKQKRSVS